MFEVLVIDNHPLIREYVSTLLGKEGYSVLVAEDGLAAVDILRTSNPKVIFVDLIMPNIDGLEMIRILRSDPKYKDMQIIAVSSLDPREVDERGGLPHDVQLFPKPIPFNDIETIVRGAFEQRGRRFKAAAR